MTRRVLKALASVIIPKADDMLELMPAMMVPASTATMFFMAWLDWRRGEGAFRSYVEQVFRDHSLDYWLPMLAVAACLASVQTLVRVFIRNFKQAKGK